jgi:hypothetical protein
MPLGRSLANELGGGDDRAILDHLFNLVTASSAVATCTACSGDGLHGVRAGVDGLCHGAVGHGPANANVHDLKIMKTIISFKPQPDDSP